jgi:protein-tyrosine-phosphatase
LQKTTKPLKVLFICLGNSCRSQMAEAIARHEATDVIEAASAGLVPLGFIAKPTISTLAESGIPCRGQTSKGITREAVDASDLVVNMCGHPLPPLAKGRARVEDWDVEDPYGEEGAIYRRICEDIRRRVKDLAQRIRAELNEGTGKAEI